jgi:hypothetical protein
VTSTRIKKIEDDLPQQPRVMENIGARHAGEAAYRTSASVPTADAQMSYHHLFNA